MPTYTCRIYSNTGFNSTNIPDSPTRLNSLGYTDVTALDILQNRFLSSIRVPLTWDYVKDADYCALINNSDTSDVWYYSIDGVSMTATDVAILSVTPDFISSVGGVSGFDILDGITERVHVSNDSYALWNGDDSLLTPCLPLQLTTVWTSYWQSNPEDDFIMIESTLDPVDTLCESEAITYTDSSGTKVQVPGVSKNSHYTSYIIGGESSTVSVSPGTCVYYDTIANYVSSDLAKGVANLRSLGLEQAIVNQVVIPRDMVNVTATAITVTDGTTTYNYNAAYEIEGISATIAPADANLAYVNTTATNNLINYSNFQKYGIMTCSGETMEVNPSDAYVSTLTAPTISVRVDPHIDGRPYYRFTYLNGNNEFWHNCIAGEDWKQVPLIYTGGSRSALNTLKYNYSKELASYAYNRDYYNAQNSERIAYGTMAQTEQAANLIPGTDISADLAISTVQTIGSATFAGMSGGAGAAVMQAGVSAQQTGIMSKAKQEGINKIAMVQSQYALDSAINNKNYLANAYPVQRKSELTDLYINNVVQAPTVQIPYHTDPIRDIKGNGFCCYRYTYQAADVTRIDKLLTMYGYKVNKPLESSDFTNRTYFNFVMCSNVTVGGNAKWINEGIEAQLKAGVRVWHTTPSTSYYTNNPIAS